MPLVEIHDMNPLEAANRLASRSRLSFLDSAMPHATLGRWSYLACDPVGVFRIQQGGATWNGTPLEGSAMDALRSVLARHARGIEAGGPPFQGGAIGRIAYEAGGLFEPLPALPPSRAGHADIDLAFYDTVLAIDGIDRRAFIASTGMAGVTAMREKLAVPPARRSPPPRLRWHDDRTRAEYEGAVARVIDYIRDGDIFQANLSHRFTARPCGALDPMATYRALRNANPAPFAALLVDGASFLASTSPERFLRVTGREVETRPIKGTARRSPDKREDAVIAAALERSEKDRAENVMIVDLLRNDLSRVCEPGSVTVPVLCGIETYASVHHLTSVVRGSLRSDRDIVDLVAATFPGGSITGAPKIRAMQIIGEVEGAPRGAYCGSIGWIGADGNADLNIAIRTLAFDGDEVSVGAGGGITLLSDPAAEYDETLAKAERLLAALGPDSWKRGRTRRHDPGGRQL